MVKQTVKPLVHDVIRVETTVVSCNGESTKDPSGHPLVYLNMGDEGHVICPYCSREYVFVDQSEFKG